VAQKGSQERLRAFLVYGYNFGVGLANVFITPEK